MTATNCPFCSPKIEVREEKIHFETPNWRVTDNKTAYENAELHLLILPLDHVIRIHDVNDHTPDVVLQQLGLDEWRELYTMVIPEIIEKFGPGTLAIRLGSFEVTGSTVEHLHLHWVRAKPGETTYINAGPEKFSTEKWQRKS